MCEVKKVLGMCEGGGAFQNYCIIQTRICWQWIKELILLSSLQHLRAFSSFKWVNDSCLIPSEQFFSYVIGKNKLQFDEKMIVCCVLDQHA